MLFGNYAIDKTIEEHVTEIAELACDPKTLIFIDTNIVSYMYKLHDAARREFFAWSDTVAASDRLFVPAWVANEYLSKVTSNTLATYTPKGKEPTQARKLWETLQETASLFVDDTSLRGINYQGDRAAFLRDFRQAIEALNRFAGVFSQQFDPGVIHQQVVDHLSQCILTSDLSALCTRAMHEAKGRIEHRLPPGFRDDGKPENRLGDLIIWYEILEKSLAVASSFTKVLFISRDEKSDWVYAPAQRAGLAKGKRKSVPNSDPQIKLVDPRLVAEFTLKTGLAGVTIANLPALVEGLSKRSPSEFQHLAAAIQINVQETVTPAAEPLYDQNAEAPAEAQQVEVPDVGEVSAEVAAPEQITQAVPATPPLTYDAEALQDRRYPVDSPSFINTIIRDLQSHNWYVQNPAVTSVRHIQVFPFTPSSWFVLGRNLYQAACGNAQKAMEFMGNLEAQLSQFPPTTAKHLLAGMLYEIYFDGFGALRRTVKFSYADKPLTLVAEEAYADVRQFIVSQLHDCGARLLFLPGNLDSKEIRIISTALNVPADDDRPPFLPPLPTHEVRSVLLDGVELMRDMVVSRDSHWLTMLVHPKLSPVRIREKISEDLAIPKWALKIETDPKLKDDLELAFPADREFYPKQAVKVP